MLRGRTLWELLDRRVDATPDALMAVDADMRTITFAEYWAEAERAAAGLLDYGVEPGSVVSWQLPNWIESLVLVGALARITAIQNPIAPSCREREVGFVTNHARSSLLIVPSVRRGFDFEEMGRSISASAGGEMRVLVSDRALPQGDPSILPPISEALDPPEQPVRWLFCTSGATAVPKCAQHTDAGIAAVASGVATRLGVIEADRNALVSPFTHVDGIAWLFVSLQTGCSNIVMEGFDPQITPEVLSREGVTLAGSGTAFHQAYLTYQRRHPMPVFPNLRALPGGGAPKPPTLVAEVREVFDVPVLSGYGLTEAPMLTMADLSDPDEELATCEGRPMPGVELRFVTLEGGIPAPGQDGEIRAKAPQVMRGYLDPLLDAEAFDEDGFLRTGDLGRLDDRGNLIVTGRASDLIIHKGERVDAKDLEDLLCAHPAVGEVAVIGLPDPDSGQRVCAVIQAVPGAGPVSIEDMVAHLREAGLVSRELPEQLELVDALPRNSAGRVLKHVLVDQFK